MKALVCADIHGRRDWWEWVAENVHQCEVVLLAGDLIGEPESPSDLTDPWAPVKEAVDHLEQSGVMVCMAEGSRDVVVVTDNDGNYQKKVVEKYQPYASPHVKICADPDDCYPTLEPQFARENDLATPRPVEAKATAIIPGRITSAGKSILGTAAMSGVRRAAFISVAAIAR